MSDLVERLRSAATHPYNQHGPHEFLTEAAARIAQLEAALRPFAKEADRYDPDDGDGDLPAWDTQVLTKDLRNARAALGEERT